MFAEAVVLGPGEGKTLGLGCLVWEPLATFPVVHSHVGPVASVLA